MSISCFLITAPGNATSRARFALPGLAGGSHVVIHVEICISKPCDVDGVLCERLWEDRLHMVGAKSCVCSSCALGIGSEELQVAPLLSYDRPDSHALGSVLLWGRWHEVEQQKLLLGVNPVPCHSRSFASIAGRIQPLCVTITCTRSGSQDRFHDPVATSP